MKWHSQTWMTIASLLTINTAQAADNKTVEVDLIFPQDGGRYRIPPSGLPITVALQNSAAAFQYGWNIWFEFYKNPRGDRKLGDGIVTFSNDIGAPAPTNATDPYFLTRTSGFLKPGEYTLEWSLGVASYCEFVTTPQQNSSLYYGNKQISGGTITITIVEDNQTDSPPDLLATGTARQCGKNLGVIGYATTSQYSHRALTVGGFNTAAGAYTFPSSSAPCVVTQTPTQSPNPCAVTVGRAVQTSIYSLMSWSMPASTSASATAPASTSTTTGAASSLMREYRGLGVLSALLTPLGLAVLLL